MMSLTEPHIYEFDDFRLDAGKRLLLRRGQMLSLTPRILDTLIYFVRHQGRVIEKDELMRAIWPDAFVEENNLNQSVSTLRRVLGESRGENRYIVTVPGHGYRFVAVVKKVGVGVSESINKKPNAICTIAVLPFKPLVEEHRDEALELGMADALIIRLSNSREVVVRPLTSVRRYGGLEQDAQTAGRELEAELVLDGSIQRWGDRIRVTARLVKTADGASLWVGTFDEKFTDVFTVQDAISERVASALSLTLSVEERKGLTKRYTENPKAYELYLKGRYHWNKLIPPEVRKSIHYFQQAIEIDPYYALAYTGLTAAHISLPISSDVPPAESFPQAKAAATKALEIDESLADAHTYLAFVKFWYDWDWADAEVETKRALALNPNSAEAHRAYAILLSQLGRQGEAIAEGARARELDPLALITRTNEALFLYYAGRDDEAKAKLTSTLEIDPSFWIALLTMAKVYIRQEKYDEGSELLARARMSSGGSTQTISLMAYVLAVSGQRNKALAVLEELKGLSTERYIPPYNFALVYHGLKLDEEALDWLERAYDARDVLLAAFIKCDPIWDSLRGDPRFAAIVQRMNLE